MASALVFLVDKPLTSKGPQTYFDATHITSKKKHFKTLQKGDTPDIKGDIIVEVNSIRLEENTETPIMLLLDPSSQKVLPIWIGTIEAVSIAYAQEGIKHPRPQTHDLIIDIIESLNGTIDEVVISDLKDNTYFAEIVILGDHGKVSLSSRPSDAIALALRTDTTISVNGDLFLNNSIDLIHDKTNEIEEFKSFLENIEPEDFV